MKIEYDGLTHTYRAIYRAVVQIVEMKDEEIKQAIIDHVWDNGEYIELINFPKEKVKEIVDAGIKVLLQKVNE